jgi:hypothetical protein
MTLLAPPTTYGLRAKGMSPEAASATVVEVLVSRLTRTKR